MKVKPGSVHSVACLTLLSCIGVPAFSAPSAVMVPGTSDLWLAGMPPGSRASQTDAAPAQSPVQVKDVTIAPGTFLTFSAVGTVSNGLCGPPYCPTFGPDGGIKPDEFPLFHEAGAENGISNLGSPINALIGVFLGPSAPSSNPPPPALNFSSQRSQDYLTISPGVRQAFFIGDGLANGSKVQRVVVPRGATRLFLGTMDGCCWSDNHGSFTVHIGPAHIAQIPEPPTRLTLLLGICWLLLSGAATRTPKRRLDDHDAEPGSRSVLGP